MCNIYNGCSLVSVCINDNVHYMENYTFIYSLLKLLFWHSLKSRFWEDTSYLSSPSSQEHVESPEWSHVLIVVLTVQGYYTSPHTHIASHTLILFERPTQINLSPPKKTVLNREQPPTNSQRPSTVSVLPQCKCGSKWQRLWATKSSLYCNIELKPRFSTE